jgi:chorismate mutase
MVNLDSNLKSYLLQSFNERMALRQDVVEIKKHQIEPSDISEESRLLKNAYRLMRRDNIEIPTDWEIGDEIVFKK